MNKLLAMEVFVQVVDCGGFTRAAETMKLPKATVSTLVKALEISLAAVLLSRTTRQMQVTSEGLAYYEHCLRILSDVGEAEEILSGTHLSPSGRLRVDAPTGLMHYVTCASPAYLQQHGCPKHPDELIHHRCVNYFSTRTSKTFDWYFQRDGERLQVALPSRIAVSDSYAYTATGTRAGPHANRSYRSPRPSASRDARTLGRCSMRDMNRWMDA